MRDLYHSHRRREQVKPFPHVISDLQTLIEAMPHKQ
jgi:hypothetical protein